MTKFLADHSRSARADILFDDWTELRLFQKVLLEVIDPGIALIHLRVGGKVKCALELAATGFEIGLLGGNLGMGWQIIDRLNYFLSFFGQDEIKQQHRRVRMRRPCHR